MKWIDGIWERVTSFENLLRAYRKAWCGKRSRPDVAEFRLNPERELLALQRALREGTYRPGDYRLFRIYERKSWVIAAAPFCDRVVNRTSNRNRNNADNRNNNIGFRLAQSARTARRKVPALSRSVHGSIGCGSGCP